MEEEKVKCTQKMIHLVPFEIKMFPRILRAVRRSEEAEITCPLVNMIAAAIIGLKTVSRVSGEVTLRSVYSISQTAVNSL